MPVEAVVSTAYLPPVEWFSVIGRSAKVSIESHENYIKQTYRNRCYILSAHGPQMLSVPVLEGSRRKVPITEIRIDYSKRWQQVHLGAIRSSYRMAPYYEFYSGEIEEIIASCHTYLWELNMNLLTVLLKLLKINTEINLTEMFVAPSDESHDFRYRIDPGRKSPFNHRNYFQVFSTPGGFSPNLSIIDLVFNQGPDAGKYL
jgi:hypothetical protein